MDRPLWVPARQELRNRTWPARAPMASVPRLRSRTARMQLQRVQVRMRRAPARPRVSHTSERQPLPVLWTPSRQWAQARPPLLADLLRGMRPARQCLSPRRSSTAQARQVRKEQGRWRRRLPAPRSRVESSPWPGVAARREAAPHRAWCCRGASWRPFRRRLGHEQRRPRPGHSSPAARRREVPQRQGRGAPREAVWRSRKRATMAAAREPARPPPAPRAGRSGRPWEQAWAQAVRRRAMSVLPGDPPRSWKARPTATLAQRWEPRRPLIPMRV
jgi:hypothetical protein